MRGVKVKAKKRKEKRKDMTERKVGYDTLKTTTENEFQSMLWRSVSHRNSSNRKELLLQDWALPCEKSRSYTVLSRKSLARKAVNKLFRSASCVLHFNKTWSTSSRTAQVGHLSPCCASMHVSVLPVNAEPVRRRCRRDTLARDMPL